MSAERRVEKLRPDHKIEGFDCGRDELNRYLLRYAWQNQRAGAAQTYVGLVGDSVISLAIILSRSVRFRARWRLND